MNPEKVILLVEDEPAMALGITDALSFEGYRVVHAPTGRQGVEFARTASPDLVLLDLMLPDTNGYEVCIQLRRWSRTVPILILSGGADERSRGASAPLSVVYVGRACRRALLPMFAESWQVTDGCC